MAIPAIKLFRFFLVILVAWPAFAWGQDLETKVSINTEQKTLEEVLVLLEEQTGVSFFFNNNLLELEDKVTLKVDQQPLGEALNQMLRVTDLCYKVVAGQIVLKSRDQIKDEQEWVRPYLNRRSFTVSGVLRDASSGEDLVGATVFVKDKRVGTTANAYGFFSLTLPEGDYQLEASILGFQSREFEIDLRSDQRMELKLEPSTTQLEEVIIAADELENLRDFEQNISKLPMQQYTSVPALLGGKDILEGVQVQPGILRKTEGTTGFHVRGGNLDQNLILIDEAPVYNESHFLGFLSVFNWNTLKSAEFYRAGIPARYGGRLSSVLDLRMKEGNSKKFTGLGEITPLYGQLTVEGPIIKEKASFLLSGRRSYPDLFLDTEIENQFNVRDFNFFDLNGKANIQLGKKDHLFLSGYWGRDKFQNEEDFFSDQQWGNTTGTFRWNHVFNKKLFANLSLIFSDYNYFQTEEFEDAFYFLGLGIYDLTAKIDFNYYPSPRHKVQFGVSLTNHLFVPGEEESDDGENDESNFINLIPPQQALESGVYISDEYAISEKWNVNAGLRYSLFENYGDATVNFFDEEGNLIRQEVRTEGVYNTEGGLEPRLKLSYEWRPRHLFFLSYDRTRQYLHLATNTVNKAPTDIWVPTSNNIKPQIADQVSIGWLSLWKEKTYQIQSALYYKRGKNAIDFRERANLILNELVEAEMRQGDLNAYGWETQLLKQKGKITGALNYTLSNTTLKIPGINNGKEYPAAYHRLHDVNLWLKLRMKKRWVFNINGALSSGLPTNFPIGNFALQGEVFVMYGPKNSDQLPVYHRVDLGVTREARQTARWKGEWTLSIYNVYNRYNAYSIVFEDADVGTNRANLQYIFPFTPSLTFRFKF